MKNTNRLQSILRTIQHFFVFFLIVAFLVTCTTMLFVTVLTGTLDITLTDENLGIAAKLTMLNVVILSAIFTALDIVRRKLTVEKTANSIADAAEKIIAGDYSVRIKVSPYFNSDAFFKISESFNRMAEELSGVETLRGDFISNVSHEMKTPLSVIRNYAKLLENNTLSYEARLEYTEAIIAATNRLSTMITNILKLNRLENQQIYPQSEAFDLSEQLCEALLSFEDVWEKKEITIHTDLPDSLPIRQDPELLFLVWNNLLSNAFKFTERGGSVTLSLSKDDGIATVTVRDTGCGMSQEIGKKMFDKFYQGDTSHATEGNGLGLALVKRVIDILQGEITVESTLGVGSTFTVRIKINERE